MAACHSPQRRRGSRLRLGRCVVWGPRGSECAARGCLPVWRELLLSGPTGQATKVAGGRTAVARLPPAVIRAGWCGPRPLRWAFRRVFCPMLAMRQKAQPSPLKLILQRGDDVPQVRMSKRIHFDASPPLNCCPPASFQAPFTKISAPFLGAQQRAKPRAQPLPGLQLPVGSPFFTRRHPPVAGLCLPEKAARRRMVTPAEKQSTSRPHAHAGALRGTLAAAACAGVLASSTAFPAAAFLPASEPSALSSSSSRHVL